MRLRPILAVIVAAAVLVPAADGATRTVRLESRSFAPHAITIHKGDRVRFSWAAGLHNVRRVSGPAFTKIRQRDRGTVQRTFSTVGRYRLVCSLHRDLGMYLTVTVKR